MAEYKFRNYKDGDEVKQAEIYNSVIKEMNPNQNEATADQIKTRYGNENWKPNQVTYVVVNSEVVGYAGFAYGENFVNPGVPYIPLSVHLVN